MASRISKSEVEKIIKSYDDNLGTQIGYGFTTILNMVTKMFGFDIFQVVANPTIMDTKALINKTISLTDKIIKDYQNKVENISTPTTGRSSSIQSFIQQIYSKYSNEAYEIMRLANQQENDMTNVEMETPGYDQHKHADIMNKDSIHLNNQAQLLDKHKQEADKLASTVRTKAQQAYKEAYNGLQKKK